MSEFDYELCESCKHEDSIPDCDECRFNKGYETSDSSYTAGSCGQQNCWYGCVVCKNNSGCNYTE